MRPGVLLAPAGCQLCPSGICSLLALAAPMLGCTVRNLCDGPVLVPATFAELAWCPGR